MKRMLDLVYHTGEILKDTAAIPSTGKFCHNETEFVRVSWIIQELTHRGCQTVGSSQTLIEILQSQCSEEFEVMIRRGGVRRKNNTTRRSSQSAENVLPQVGVQDDEDDLQPLDYLDDDGGYLNARRLDIPVIGDSSDEEEDAEEQQDILVVSEEVEEIKVQLDPKEKVVLFENDHIWL